MRNNMKLAAAVALVAITAGCNLKAPAASNTPAETTFGGKGNTGSATTGSQTGAVGAGATGNGTIGAGATTGGAAQAFDTSKMPTTAQALAGATAMPVTAQTGGMYRSADGTLTADIPPGALSQDATIKISRIDTSSQPASDFFVPGIQFAVDLGGAELAPDTQIMVKAAVDPRFVDEMKARDPNFSLEHYNLTMADGKYFMAMPVRGPSSKSQTSPLNPDPTLGAWNLNEFGGFPLPTATVGAAGASTYQVQFKAGSYDYDDEQVKLTNGQVIIAPKSQAQWHSMEAAGQFGCGAFPHCYYYGKLATRAADKPQRDALVSTAKSLRSRIPASDLAPALKTGDKVTLNALPSGVTLGTASTDLPSDAPLTLGELTGDTGTSLTFRATAGTESGSVTFNVTRSADVTQLRQTEDAIRALDLKADAAASSCNIVVTPDPIKTHTTWVSDDESLNGKDAEGAVVSFQMLLNPVSGPQSVTTNDKGAANSAAQRGTQVTVASSFKVGTKGYKALAPNGTEQILALAGDTNTVEFKAGKYSPQITLNVASDEQAVSGTLHVGYTLDGTARTQDIAVPAAAKKTTVKFYALVPNDADHKFALTSVSVNDEFRALKVPANVSTVQRNGGATYSVTLVNNAAK